VEDSLGDRELSTMERLRDGQVKLGAARYEQYAGSQRRIVNQIRAGTVSRHTLLNAREKIGALMGVSHVQG
jgi:cytochrome b